MRAAYFVSDLHLTSPDDDRATLFLSFLRSLSGRESISHLFLMGDIFDLWLADHRHFVGKFRVIIDEIVRLRDEGVEIHYFEGNHDLHLKYYWSDRLGVTVHAGPLYFDLGEQRLRLEHGDQMDPDDKGYRFLRWFLRTPPLRFLIRHLPQALVIWLGERASASSRSYTSNMKTISDTGAVDKIRTHAQLAYAEKPFDLIISGHLHTRDDHTFHQGNDRFRSVNLGTWLDAPCYFKIDGAEGRLYECSEKEKVA